MRTTLVIPDQIAQRVKNYTQRVNQTLSDFVAEALEHYLIQKSVVHLKGPFRLSTVKLGAPAVNINDRDALFLLQDQRSGRPKT